MGQQILQLSAVDGDDSGKNSIRWAGPSKVFNDYCRYFIEENDYIAVDASTGAVTVLKMPAELGEKVFSVSVRLFPVTDTFSRQKSKIPTARRLLGSFLSPSSTLVPLRSRPLSVFP